MYDWANSAFMLTIVTAVFPYYFYEIASGDLGPDEAQQRYAETTRNFLIAVAVMAPLLGAFADVRAIKKLLLAVFAGIGVAATAAMFVLLPGDWVLALLLFGIANVGAAGSVVFYDALLPHVAKPDEMDRLSTSGFALGYVGSGLLLIFNLALIERPGWFGLPHGEGLSASDKTLPVRLSFLSVAIWWAAFTLPLLRKVREPAAIPADRDSRGLAAVGASFRRLAATFRELRSYKQALLMLVAFLIYNDGIVTLIRMAGIYAASMEFDKAVVISSILVLQFIGVPFSILFGSLGSRIGTKPMVLVGISIYSVICVFAYFMTDAWHFVVLALLVGTVQGGTQGLSRSLFASMIPQAKSGEFFALFAVGEKFAGFTGPAVFALMIGLTGSAENAILSLIGFFVLGGILLTRVDVDEGRRQASAGAP